MRHFLLALGFLRCCGIASYCHCVICRSEIFSTVLLLEPMLTCWPARSSCLCDARWRCSAGTLSPLVLLFSWLATVTSSLSLAISSFVVEHCESVICCVWIHHQMFLCDYYVVPPEFPLRNCDWVRGRESFMEPNNLYEAKSDIQAL